MTLPTIDDQSPAITPHDIAQLAQTRRRDPELAMKIAAASAAQSVDSTKQKEARNG